MNKVLLPCDLCGNKVFHKVFSGDKLPEKTNLESFYSSSRKIVIRPSIVQCDKCGLVMSNSRDEDNILQDVYNIIIDESFEIEERNRAHTARKRLEWIMKFQYSGKLLDVGCANGIFLKESELASWDVLGIEPSSWAVEQARNRCPKANIIHGHLEKTSFPLASFELITLWDVLEHLPSPTQVLKKLRPWLVQDGLIAINLPNVESFIAKLMGKYWVLFLREHLWYFSPTTITHLFKKSGFKILDIRPNNVRFSLSTILKRLNQYPGIPSFFETKVQGKTILNSINFEFPIGEMSVLAQKTEE